MSPGPHTAVCVEGSRSSIPSPKIHHFGQFVQRPGRDAVPKWKENTFPAPLGVHYTVKEVKGETRASVELDWCAE